jgi:hypothetical protein
MEKGWKILIAVAIVLLVGFLILMKFYYRNCENLTCFEDQLKECKKAKFISSGKMIFEYIILGETEGKCDVRVVLLEGDLNNQDSIKLEGKDMICSIPFGILVSPESDIGLCSGPLKEGLQELIISKLYSYVVKNFGKINADLMKVS